MAMTADSTSEVVGRAATRLVPFLPVFGAVVVVGTVYGLWTQLLLGNALSQRELILSVDPSIENIEFRARVFWALAALSVIMSMVWNVIVSAWIIRTYASRAHLPSILTLVSVGIIGLIIVVHYWSLSGKASELIHNAITHRTTLDIRRITAWLDPAAASVVVLVLTASCVLVSGRKPHKHDSMWVAARVRAARVALYSACALLAAGVTEIYFLFSWPASFTVAADAQLVQHLAATIGLAAGCVFTLLLLAIFVPVSVVHSAWINDAIERTPKPAGWTREEWLQQSNLEVTTFGLLSRAIAILIPTLVGALPKLFT